MKKKSLFGLMLTMALALSLLSGLPVNAAWEDGVIKIGAIGPLPWIQGQGIAEGVQLAADQINAGPDGDIGSTADNGIINNGNQYKIEVVTADTLRGMPDPTGTTGAAAASELVTEGCQFVVGGFRTEACMGLRETLMDYKKIWIIAGAATNELVYEPAKPNNLYDNYDRYKYIFRSTPVNSTQLFYAVAGYLKFLMIAKLMPMYTQYAAPLKVAVISEALTWADVIHTNLAMEYVWNTVMGMSTYGGVDVVYTARVSPVTTDVSAELTGVKASGARLLISIISGPSGRTMAKQWADLGVNAFLAGIDVPGQEIPLHWDATGGKAEFECFLATCGTETPVYPRTLAFYQATMSKYGHAPIYTSYGAYDAVIGLEQLLELGYDGIADNGDEPVWPATSDYMVPFMEKAVRDGSLTVWDYSMGATTANTGIVGKFQYTGPHPMGSATYDTKMINATHSYLDINPTMQGTQHDIYSGPLVNALGQDDAHGPFWLNRWVRAFNFQWQFNTKEGEGRLEYVYPLDQPFSTKVKIPPHMYSLAEVDISPNGAVDVTDIGAMGTVWLSSPGTAAWMSAGTFLGLLADMDYDKLITIADVGVVAKAFGQSVPTWPLP